MKVYLLVICFIISLIIDHSESRRRRPNVLRYPSRNRVRNSRCSTGMVYATCVMKEGVDNRNGIRGRIDFVQPVDRHCIPTRELQVRVQIMGLESDDCILDHGLHVHKYGDVSDQCQAAGPHYNPFEQDHGGRSGSPRHIGDLGNVREDGDGRIIEVFRVPQTSIVGPRSIIGRAVVLHARQDDLGLSNNEESRRTGNSGSRLACCVIGRSESVRSSITNDELTPEIDDLFLMWK